MNYYEHHIGDYDADTAHLSWAEDMAYARLLRLYYRREKPIPADVKEACRLVRAVTKDQCKAVETVLAEFFTADADGWHQQRCDSEIAVYQKKVEHNRSVGKLGGRPRKIETQPKPTGLSLGLETEPKHNPPQTPDPSLNSVAKATGENADPIFGDGLAYLVKTGVPEKGARSFLGKMRKALNNDLLAVELLVKAQQLEVSDPVPWLRAAAQKRMGPSRLGGSNGVAL